MLLRVNCLFLTFWRSWRGTCYLWNKPTCYHWLSKVLMNRWLWIVDRFILDCAVIFLFLLILSITDHTYRGIWWLRLLIIACWNINFGKFTKSSLNHILLVISLKLLNDRNLRSLLVNLSTRHLKMWWCRGCEPRVAELFNTLNIVSVITAVHMLEVVIWIYHHWLRRISHWLIKVRILYLAWFPGSTLAWRPILSIIRN